MQMTDPLRTLYKPFTNPLMQLWPKIAAHFHMETGPNLHISLDTMMNTPEKKDIWAKIVKVSSAPQLCKALEGTSFREKEGEIVCH